MQKKFAPRIVFFGGKTAPGYLTAKRIIKLINSIAEILNHDLDTKIIMYQHAEIILPAYDISQHISLLQEMKHLAYQRQNLLQLEELFQELWMEPKLKWHKKLGQIIYLFLVLKLRKCHNQLSS